MIETTDGQLLDRFARHRDEAAFSTLARRHAAQVRGVCRRVLTDERDVEDALQATFLVLARKAGLLPDHPSVGPWLSAVAYRVALNARASRRRCRELPAGLLCGDPEDGPEPAAPVVDLAAETDRQELGRLVREEVGCLPEKYRSPMVLCYLEGKTNLQAAHELGWASGSIARRLEKARRLLRDRLTCRGVAPVVLVLVVAVAAFWLSRTNPASDRSVAVVADAMKPLREGGGNPPHAEGLLLRVAETGPRSDERNDLLALATEAARVADRIEDHDPGRRREEWTALAREMGAASRRLASATAAGDRAEARRSAAQLYDTCARCHRTFRD